MIHKKNENEDISEVDGLISIPLLTICVYDFPFAVWLMHTDAFGRICSIQIEIEVDFKAETRTKTSIVIFTTESAAEKKRDETQNIETTS